MAWLTGTAAKLSKVRVQFGSKQIRYDYLKKQREEYTGMPRFLRKGE